MTSADGYRLGRRSTACAGCGAAFEPGQRVVSALYEARSGDPGAEPAGDPGSEAAGDQFERRDLCSACFDDDGRRGAPFSWWAAEVPEPEKRKAAVFDLAVAREFLARLLQQDEPARASLRYLLVLMLLRKRAVEVTEQYTDARGDVMVVTLPPDDRSHEVVCVEIDEAEAAALRDELGRLFEL